MFTAVPEVSALLTASFWVAEVGPIPKLPLASSVKLVAGALPLKL